VNEAHTRKELITRCSLCQVYSRWPREL